MSNFEEDKTLAGINFQCSDALQVCMAIEREGISFYEQAAKKVSNPAVKEVFKKLAREEKDHSKTLQEKWKYLQPVVNRRAPFNEEVNNFIQNEVRGRVFPSSENDAVQVPELETDLGAIEFGIACETRSIEILEHLLDNERKIDVKAIFSHLIAEEKRHLAALEMLKAELEN